MTMTRAPTLLSSTHRRFVAISVIAVLIGVAAMSALAPRIAANSFVSAGPLTGWLWSDTTGWISMNCSSDPGGCAGPGGSWGVSVDGSGNLTGYAWSDTIGWIKFGGLSGFPSGSGTTAANATLINNVFNGWARACAGTVSSGDPYLSQLDYPVHYPQPIGDCSTMTSRPDGWDGWISLKGLASDGSAYGPTVGANGTTLGYAWGSDVNGWVQFSSGTAQLACQNFVGITTCGDASKGQDPNSIYQSDTFGNACQLSTCTSPSACQNGTSGASCVYPHPACSISDGSGGTVCITALPALINSGKPVTVTWGVNYVKNYPDGTPSCTIGGTNGNSWTSAAGASDPFPASGSQLSSIITSQTTFTITCLGVDGQTHSWSAIVGTSPSFQER